jgi:hypothetical protein
LTGAEHGAGYSVQRPAAPLKIFFGSMACIGHTYVEAADIRIELNIQRHRRGGFYQQALAFPQKLPDLAKGD